jgi:hypothetical protein
MSYIIYFMQLRTNKNKQTKFQINSITYKTRGKISEILGRKNYQITRNLFECYNSMGILKGH